MSKPEKSTKSRIFDLLVGKGVEVLRQVVCQKQRGSGAYRGNGIGGIHNRKNGHSLYIARKSSGPPAQAGGSSTGKDEGETKKCAKVELVSLAEQTSQIALSQLRDEGTKDQFMEKLLQLSAAGQRGKKKKRKAGKKQISGIKIKRRKKVQGPEIPIFK